MTLLERAVEKLSRVLGEDVRHGWEVANWLHIWGFHEVKLEAQQVGAKIFPVRRLIELAKEVELR